MLISPEYLALQKELHSRGSYGISAGKWAQAVDELARGVDAISVLDYGCGQGLLGQNLPKIGNRSYHLYEYDPAIPGKHTSESADLVFCGDVLEHIEPLYLEPVLDDLARLARKAVMLVVATRPAKKILADGRNAHLIVNPAWWWLQRLDERWGTRGFAGSEGEFQYIGFAK